MRAENLGCKTICFAEHAEQEVFRTDVLVIQSFCFLCSMTQDMFAFFRKRKIDRSRQLFSDRDAFRNFGANVLNRRPIGRKPCDEVAIFPQQTKEKTLALDRTAAELAGLAASEENHASCLFCISFEHHYLRRLSLLYPFVLMVGINKRRRPRFLCPPRWRVSG